MGTPFMRSVIFLPGTIFFLMTGLVDHIQNDITQQSSIGKGLQPPELKGFVIDEKDGYGVPGASVIVKGTRNGVAAKSDGAFTIRVSIGDTLDIAAVGYVRKYYTIKEKSLKNDLKIILKRAEMHFNGY